jgi:hypothetical protein
MGDDNQYHIFTKHPAAGWSHPASRKSACGDHTLNMMGELLGIGRKLSMSCQKCKDAIKPPKLTQHEMKV